jgi:hypothetical protein
LPTAVEELIHDFSLQLRVSAINAELRGHATSFRAEVMDYLVDAWDSLSQWSSRRLFPERYGPEGDYGYATYEPSWKYRVVRKVGE